MFIRTRLGICAATVGLLLSLGGGSLAQDRSSDVRGCALIDKSHPGQFILYESKSGSKINLRLRNNTDCAIIVETDDELPTQRKTLPNGALRIDPITGAQDGARLGLHYLIQDRQRGKAPKPGYGWGDSVFIYQIPPGESVIFAVPADHFKRRLDISVPFNYSWEGRASVAMGTGGVIHRVYFLFNDLLPATLR